VRFRDIASALGYLIVFPAIFLRSLPGGLRWARLDAREARDRRIDFDVADVRAVRGWTRDFVSMASGLETYELLELELGDGRRVVRADYDGRIRRGLAARGMSKIEYTHLGKDVSMIACLAWVFFIALPLAIAVVSWRACRS
jgi:hypothetical protein